MRLASIDIGTQTIRLLVADCNDSKHLIPVFRDREIIRLGENMDESGNLGLAQMERAVACISEFKKKAETFKAERILAAATACVRKASNSEAFIRKTVSRTGITPEILSGKKEARLSLTGVRSVTDPKGLSLVTDIGGGSTELVLIETGRDPEFESLELGVVILTEQFLKNDPPLPEEAGRMQHYIREILSKTSLIPGPVKSDITLIGTAGTITTLAAMDLEMTAYDPDKINGHILDQKKITALFQHMVKMPSAKRCFIPGLETGRETVIIAGTLIVLAILERVSSQTLTVSDAGLLEGILIDHFRTTTA